MSLNFKKLKNFEEKVTRFKEFQRQFIITKEFGKKSH